jgi:hypothetical protein
MSEWHGENRDAQLYPCSPGQTTSLRHESVVSVAENAAAALRVDRSASICGMAGALFKRI